MNNRPTGISILSVLFMVGGFAVLVIQTFFSGTFSEGLPELGVSGIALIANLLILGLWGITAGVGMWTGFKWGWWAGALYLSYSVFRNANALLVIQEMVEKYPNESVDVTRYYVKHAGRIVVHLLFIIYFFKTNVLQFFELGTDKRIKRFFKFVGASILIAALMTLITMI